MYTTLKTNSFEKNLGYADAGESTVVDWMETIYHEEMVPRGWNVVKCWRTSSPHRSDLSYSADLYTKQSTLDGPGMATAIGLASHSIHSNSATTYENEDSDANGWMDDGLG